MATINTTGQGIINAAGQGAYKPMSVPSGSQYGGAIERANVAGYMQQGMLDQGRALLAQLSEGLAPEFKRAREEAAKTVAEQMQSRNIRGSGIHAEVITDAMRQLTEAEETAKNKLVLDVYNTIAPDMRAQLDREFQLGMYLQQAADQQSAANQAKRGSIISGALGIASAAAGAGMFGGGGGGGTKPASTISYTAPYTNIVT